MRIDPLKIRIGLLGILLFSQLSAVAQCAMCRAVLESSGDQKQGEAVNDGIVYLMAVPYIVVGCIGYFIYRMNAKKNASETQDSQP